METALVRGANRNNTLRGLWIAVLLFYCSITFEIDPLCLRGDDPYYMGKRDDLVSRETHGPTKQYINATHMEILIEKSSISSIYAPRTPLFRMQPPLTLARNTISNNRKPFNLINFNSVHYLLQFIALNRSAFMQTHVPYTHSINILTHAHTHTPHYHV